MAIADNKALLAEIMNVVDDHVTAKASRQLEQQIMDVLDGYQVATMVRNESGDNVGKWLFWQDDPDANVYECSACHEPLTLNEGTPRENNFNFCPFCGLPMKEGDDDV